MGVSNTQEKGDDMATEQAGTGRCISSMTHSFGWTLLICRSSKLNAVDFKKGTEHTIISFIKKDL